MKESLKAKITAALSEGELTAYQLASKFSTSQNSIRRRLTDLKRVGAVQVARKQYMNGSYGQQEQVWALAQQAAPQATA